MVLRSCALLTPFRQGASHRRKVLRICFMLSAPLESFVLRMKFSVGACSITVKAKCAKESVTIRDQTSAFTFARDVIFFARAIEEKSQDVFLKVKYEGLYSIAETKSP